MLEMLCKTEYLTLHITLIFDFMYKNQKYFTTAKNNSYMF